MGTEGHFTFAQHLNLFFVKHSFFILAILIMTASTNAHGQQPDFPKVKAMEQRLDDVMEIIDTTALKAKLQEVERDIRQDSSFLNKLRLGIIYHETALNLSFLEKTTFRGYAQKSYDLLTDLANVPATPDEALPFVASYRASALSLVGAETRKLGLVGDAFRLFEEAVEKYAPVSYLPEFMRGSVAENLPWFFFAKRKLAKKDFQSIIDKQKENPDYANWKVMSFTYWAWAKQHQGRKYREQALRYLDRAIDLDPNYQAGRERAERLREVLAR